MRRETTASMNAGTTRDDLSAGNACWETAPEVFQKLNADFGPFDVDLFADEARALCRVWLGPGSPHQGGRFGSPQDGSDALAAKWSAFGVNGFGNPPYGPFVQRALSKAKREASEGFTSTLLLPMRVTKAFKACVLQGASELLFCDSRLTFYENGEPRWNAKKLREEGLYVPDPAMFDSIIVRYRPVMKRVLGDDELRVGLWHVPDHTSAAIARKKAA